jgi:glucan phosphorylase
MNKPSSILVVVERTGGASDLIKKALEIARRFGARAELFLCQAEAYELAHVYDRELFHDSQPGGWVRLMKGTISKNAAYFNCHRMMRRYATEAYLR